MSSVDEGNKVVEDDRRRDGEDRESRGDGEEREDLRGAGLSSSSSEVGSSSGRESSPASWVPLVC